MSRITSISIASITSIAGLALAGNSASAALITTPGADAENGSEWRSTSVVKPLDVDGDSVYGSEGYVAWYTESAGYGGSFKQSFSDPLTLATTLQSVPSYLDLDATGGWTEWSILSNAYPNFDDPTQVPGASTSDVKPGLSGRKDSAGGTLLTLSFLDPSPDLRLGVIARSTGGDALASVTLTQTVGGSATASYASTVTGSDAFVIYFFDLTDIQAGDAFQLSGTDSSGNVHTLYNGLTLDVIPEPASLALLGLGTLAMLPRRR